MSRGAGWIRPGESRIERLCDEQKDEVLSFLAIRPDHTFLMLGSILDNGLESSLNRGTFYGHKNDLGQLDGVALIGHVVLFETANEDAVSEFARLTQQCESANTIVAEAEKAERFLKYYTDYGQRPRLVYREQLFEQRIQQDAGETAPELRLAVAADLDLVAKVHAEMACEESGINPLYVDPDGFYKRCARRIEKGRVWVHVKDGELIFKADIISDTPDVVYLEGVYVSPSKRSTGVGVRFLKQLTNNLLAHTNSVCLLANQQNPAAISCYKKAGYQLRDLYDTLYLDNAPSSAALSDQAE
jgi:GNAT superfamily N-acetyltransferase